MDLGGFFLFPWKGKRGELPFGGVILKRNLGNPDIQIGADLRDGTRSEPARPCTHDGPGFLL